MGQSDVSIWHSSESEKGHHVSEPTSSAHRAGRLLATNSQLYRVKISNSTPAIFSHLLWSNRTKFSAHAKVTCLVFAKAHRHTRSGCYFWPTSALQSTCSVYFASSKRVASGRGENLRSLLMDHLTDVMRLSQNLRLRECFVLCFVYFWSSESQTPHSPRPASQTRQTRARAEGVQEEEQFPWPDTAPFTWKRLRHTDDRPANEGTCRVRSVCSQICYLSSR